MAIQAWCASRRLQLNPDKTEVIWFGSKCNIAKLMQQDISLRLGTVEIEPTSVVRDLGVLLDPELTMRPHIARTALVSSTCVAFVN